jgi:hypothetical protein
LLPLINYLDKSWLKFFDKTFQNAAPHKSFIYPAKEAEKFYPETNIIDTEEAASYPLIGGFHVKSAVDIILETSKMKSRKSVLAIARGAGGGKTRALMEINKQLLQKSHVFPMAITFNSRWNHVDWKPKLPYEKDFVYQIIVRMLSIFYGHLPKELHDRYLMKLREDLLLVPEGYSNLMSDLLHQTVVHMARKLQNARNDDQTIDTFVLMIDETVELADTMKKLIEVVEKNPAKVAIELESLFTGLRETILDEAIDGMTGALMLSSLGLGPLGDSASHRLVHPIPVSARLTPEEIVSGWWIKDSFLGKTFANQTGLESMLLPLAATAADLPRAAECLTKALVTVVEPKTRKVETITKALLFGAMNEVWEEAKSNIRSRYGSGQTLTASHMLPILFQKNISSDNIHIPVMTHIKNSAFTNQILNFPATYGGKTESFSIVPTASFIFLVSKGVKDEQLNSRLQAIDKAVVDPVGLKMTDGKAVAVNPEGHLLEQVVHQSFLLKFDCLIRSDSAVKQSVFGETGIMVKEVFGIPLSTEVAPTSRFKKMLDRFVPNTMDLVKKVNAVGGYTISFQLSHQLHYREIKWISEVDKIINHYPDNMIYVFQSAKRDVFDGLVILRSPSNHNELQLFFYDCKSNQAKPTNATKKASAQRKKVDLTQFYRVKNIIDQVAYSRTMDSHLSESPVYQAMKQKNYLFFYYTTYQNETLIGLGHQALPKGDAAFVDESCVYCREPVSKNMLTFLYDIYRAERCKNIVN